MKNIYLIQSTDSDGNVIYKIGYTKNSVEKRIKQFKTGNIIPYNLIHVYEAKKYGSTIESTLHRMYSTKRLGGEWFDLNEDEINSFIDNCQKIYENIELLDNDNTWVEKRNIDFK